jgi:hypothetical protein
MRKVFRSIPECIHAFAQQTQSEGKSSSVFFYGKILYSYGYHYILAEFIADDIVLINDVGYSVSTAKHINCAFQALRQYTILRETEHNIVLVNKELNRLKEKLLKAKKPEIYINSALSLIDAHLRAQRIFKTDTNNTLDIEKFREFQEFFNTDLDKFAGKIAESKAKIKAKKQEAFDKFEKAFRSYEPYNEYKFEAQSDYDLLRLSEDGTMLETSQSVKVNLSDAKRLFKALKNGIDVTGQKIEWYLIRSIKDGVVKIGCHNIKISELENVLNKA